jgi:hypothetical protein
MPDRPQPAARIDWQAAPYVFVVAPSCPHCGSAGYSKVRSEAGGDGSTTRKVICRGCSEPYRIVIELPDSGKTI